MINNRIKNILIITSLLVIFIIPTFTDFWTTLSISDLNSSNIGLWNICTNISGGITCKNIKDLSDRQSSKLDIIRSTSILAATLVACSLILYIFYPKNYLAVKIPLFFGFICALVASSIWYTFKEVNPKNSNFGYSWYLEVIGCILSVIAAVFLPLNQ